MVRNPIIYKGFYTCQVVGNGISEPSTVFWSLLVKPNLSKIQTNAVEIFVHHWYLGHVAMPRRNKQNDFQSFPMRLMVVTPACNFQHIFQHCSKKGLCTNLWTGVIVVYQHNVTIHPKRTTATKKITASPLVEKMLRKSEQGLPGIKKKMFSFPCFLDQWYFWHVWSALSMRGASFRTIGLSSGSKSGLGAETRLRFDSPISPLPLQSFG